MTAAPFEFTDIDTLAGLLPAFEFERLIAQGGMGAVYKARQRSLDRDVAIKILPRQLGDDPIFRSAFQAEAKAMARLNHPNLVKVFDYGDLDGLLFIVMEYVPGKSLFHASHGIAIDAKQAVQIVMGVCRGLAHAHEKGIIHRDIKPANILLTLQCEPKIGDFGLARCTRTNLDGLAMGTPAYMAPELLSHPERGDPRSEVHAIGVVLRELLTGVSAETVDAPKSVIADQTLAAICAKATHADPALRYPDTSSLAGELARWMAPKTTKTLVTTVRPASPRPMPANLLAVPANPRPMPANIRSVPATPAKQGGTGHRVLLKNCAIIALLLCAIHLAWGAYQTRQEEFGRQMREEAARSSMPSEKARAMAARPVTRSRERVVTRSSAFQESSFQTLVRLGPELSAGQGASSTTGGIPQD